MTWTRTRGRADYRGYVLHLVTPTIEYKVGHPLLNCLLFLILYKLGLLRTIWDGTALISMTLEKNNAEDLPDPHERS